MRERGFKHSQIAQQAVSKFEWSEGKSRWPLDGILGSIDDLEEMSSVEKLK